MYWLFLLLAIGAFMLAISTPQLWLLVLALLTALAFFLLWIKGLYVSRFGTVADAPRALHPAELQRLREQLRPDTATETSAAAPPGEPR
ncbi:hypothetical protein [Stenotrophomonas sp. YIM B06876]|uniref:hypothetical protein n=1 Tax=Stenotrophomonas sp. YIM B06876 TaxID=3060211 RepID=UPI0027393588|nr:hypothetical protein [Stenotrophomonas sp. YIM B06876]